METRPYVSWELIGNFMTDAFRAVGVPEEDAKICADVLMESDRRGIESHGCNRFKPIYIDRINAGIQKPVTEYEILKETPTTLLVDAHDGMGMVASYRAMNSIIEKAKTYGLGMAAIRNSTHYGIAGYWAMMASRQGMIGVTGTNARPSIAPTFGVENMLGTNPLTFAFPTDDEFPFVLDCATSITQRGKIEYFARNGKSTPAGMVIGRDGEAKTDSQQILKDLTAGEAALAPLGGIGEDLAGYKGNPEFFMGTEAFKATASEILRELRESQRAPGQDRIYTAGEKEYLVWLERKDKGVPVSESVQKELIEVRDKYNLPYHFPFED